MFIENTQSKVFKFFEYVIYGFFVIYPFFIIKSFLYQGSSSRFLLLSLVTAIMAIVFGGYLYYKDSKITLWKSPILILLGFYLAYLFIAALFGVDFSASFWSRVERTSGIFYLTHVAMFVVLLVNIINKTESRIRLLKIIIITSVIYSILSLLGPQGFDFIFKNNPYDGFMFGNSSFAAMYLIGAFLLSVYYVFSKERTERRWYEYLAPILIAINPFLINLQDGWNGISGILGIAKASSIGLFVSIGLLLVAWAISKIKKTRIRNGSVIVIVVFSMAALAFVMQSLIKDDGLVRGFYEQQSTLARPVVWELSKKSVSDRPLTGWGTDNFIVAYQENFDSKILQEDYGNEAWFDRAHNVVIDQTVEGGYLGIIFYLLLYGALFGVLLYAIFKLKKRSDVVLAVVLMIYFFVHLLELQTAFDTTVSYVMLALMAAFSVYVFNRARQDQGMVTTVSLGLAGKYIGGSLMIIYFSWALFFGILPFWKIQSVNWQIRKVGSSEKRIPLYEDLFKAKVDLAGVLWRTSTDFQRGIAENSKVLENPKTAAFLLQEAQVLTQAYEDYVVEHPQYLRPYLNLADMYIYQRLFEVNKLKEADAVLDKAIEISDRHPQPYWMKAVIALYQRDFKKAREYVAIAKKMNPEAVETQRLEKYIEDSIKTFPEIFLYSFIQI